MTATQESKAWERLVGEDLIFGATSEDTAVVVDDYPYGFRLRTQIRYWIETTKHGDRFCSQTMNPKTGRWNKPKKSTYTDAAVMYRDEDDHVKWTGISTWSDKAWVDRFVELTGDHMTLAQRNKVAEVRGIQKAFEGVEFTVVETTRWTAEEKAAHDEEQARAEAVIQRRISVEAFHAKTELAREFGPIR